jgi:uncharacterized protein YkwD
MLWVDLLIVLLLAWAAWTGYRLGFILVLIELAGFVVALVAASLFYRSAASLLTSTIHLIPSFAGVAGYALVLALVELAYVFISHWALGLVPPHLNRSLPNRLAGSLLNAFKAALLMAIALVIFAGLPLTAGQKGIVSRAHIPKLLLSYSGGLQREVNSVLGSSITDTLNFLTVKPEGEESVNLGYRTTRVKVDPAAEDRMLAMVNQERTSRGLKPLRMNQQAREVARAHSEDMFARGYFSHVDPDGKDPFQRMNDAGIHFQAAGENLALAPTLELAHNGLMNSPGHRANILSTDFGTVGIGVIDGGPYGLMITQDFTD